MKFCKNIFGQSICIQALIFTSMLVFFVSASVAEVQASPKKSDAEVIYTLDFSRRADASPDEWFADQGFHFTEEAKNRKSIDLFFNDTGLVVMSNKKARGFILNKNIELKEFSSIRVTWGIIRYPRDIPRPSNTINEGLFLVVFFGSEKVPSGHVWLPDTYPFIGLFLGRDEQAGVPYKGTFYHKAGRLFCQGNPRPFETVTSVFDLKATYKSFFGADRPAPINGIGIGVNTLFAGENGKAAAYINKIEILK
jgi:hypothetical protein